MILLSFTLKELYDPIYVRDSYAAINLLVFDGCLYFRAEDAHFSFRFDFHRVSPIPASLVPST